MAAKILIIDDEDLFREDFALLLERRGHACQTAAIGEDGLQLAREWLPEVVLCDIMMPGRSGVEILDDILQLSPGCCVMMLTAHGTMETAVQAFRKGAYDYILKPPMVEDVLQRIKRYMQHRQLSQEVQFLRRELSRDVEELPMVGRSQSMKAVLRLVQQVAPTRSTVLITGESGTGKELVARAIHEMGDTQHHPFVPINCAGIPEHLLESELFGHVRGAFTGAVSQRIGHFEMAGEGSILLDEVGEMPLSLQSKLLRVLEQKEFTAVGSTRPTQLKARIIASTNRDLRAMVADGGFREDLFFRIAVFGIELPPLRERRSDIPRLVEHLVKRLNEELKRKCLGANSEAMQRLLAYDWPGNVRELRNVLERAVILHQGAYFTPAELPPQMVDAVGQARYSDSLRETMRGYEREHIRRVLTESSGNKEEAARRLEVNPSTLYRKMADLDLDFHLSTCE